MNDLDEERCSSCGAPFLLAAEATPMSPAAMTRLLRLSRPTRLAVALLVSAVLGVLVVALLGLADLLL